MFNKEIGLQFFVVVVVSLTGFGISLVAFLSFELLGIL
jgi:hypothetical protein